ncbi:MAG: sugar phosphate isomerase/epimerase [Candidatus Bathyarchaeia archaeon]
MRVGISTWTFPWCFGFPNYPKPKNPFTFMDLLNIAERYGLKIIQIGQNTPLHTFSREYLEEVYKEAKKRGIAIEAGTDGVNPEKLKKYIEIAKLLNSRVLRTYVRPEDVKGGLDGVEKLIREVINDFEKENIILLIENAEFTPTSFLRRLAEKIGKDCLRLLIDTTNQLAIPEPLHQVVENMLPFAIEVHVKEYTVERYDNLCGFQIYGAPLGKGCLNLDWLLDTLIENDKKDMTLILEQWVPFTKTVDETAKMEYQWGCMGIELLKDKLKQLGVLEL